VWPSPQKASVQSDLQALELPLFWPSSQASPGCSKPSPHLGSRQARVHWPSVVVVAAEVALLAGLLEAVAAGGELADVGAAVDVVLALPSSQASPGPTWPSPQMLRAVELAAPGVRRCRAVVALLDAGLDEAVAAGGLLAGEGAGAGVAVPVLAEVALLALVELDEAVAALGGEAQVRAVVVVVAVLAVVALLAGVDDLVAALLELAERPSSRRRR
jgi:hypothetical protein